MSRKVETPTATISPDAMRAMLDSMNEMRALVEKYKSEAEAATKAMTEASVKQATTGRTDKQVSADLACIRAFKKAGYGTVKPHEDVKSFRLWMLDGYRPVEGTKSVKVKQFSLFHRTQVRKLTAEERAAEAGKATGEAKGAKGKAAKGATVTPLHPAS
jgi:hypothetical protein